MEEDPKKNTLSIEDQKELKKKLIALFQENEKWNEHLNDPDLMVANHDEATRKDRVKHQTLNPESGAKYLIERASYFTNLLNKNTEEILKIMGNDNFPTELEKSFKEYSKAEKNSIGLAKGMVFKAELESYLKEEFPKNKEENARILRRFEKHIEMWHDPFKEIKDLVFQLKFPEINALQKNIINQMNQSERDQNGKTPVDYKREEDARKNARKRTPENCASSINFEDTIKEVKEKYLNEFKKTKPHFTKLDKEISDIKTNMVNFIKMNLPKKTGGKNIFTNRR